MAYVRAAEKGSATAGIVIAVCNPDLRANALQNFLENQTVHNSCEHTDIVGCSLVHPPGAALHAAEDISASDDNRYFNALALALLPISLAILPITSGSIERSRLAASLPASASPLSFNRIRLYLRFAICRSVSFKARIFS